LPAAEPPERRLLAAVIASRSLRRNDKERHQAADDPSTRLPNR
jgi:hypothetical protein